MKNVNKEVAPQSENSNMTELAGFKCTPEVLAKIDELADACGLHRSEYLRMVALGHKPRRRLTPEDLAVIDTLEGCRQQTQQFLNRVKGMTEEQKKYLFRDPAYYKQWKEYIEATVVEWTNIRNNLKKKG